MGSSMAIGPRDSSVGNSNAASDLYGLGVRVGIYLQAFGTFFYIVRSRAGGTKLTNAGLMLAMLATWSILVDRRSISPAEALAIHTIASVPGAPALMACYASDDTDGEGTGYLATLVAVVWRDLAMVAFWARLYRVLPLLDTANKTWFFARVDIDGWFRVFSLVVTVGTVFNNMPFLYALVKAIKSCYRTYRRRPQPERAEDPLAGLKIKLFWGFAAVLPGTLALMIALAEMTIRYNHLAPTTDMTEPGQAIPLGVGIITFVDGLLVLFGPSSKGNKSAAGDDIAMQSGTP